MIVYRFTHPNFADDISGEGARLNGGRWNNKGYPVVYTSGTISLSLLELVIHSASFDELKSNFLMHIEVPDSVAAASTSLKLKSDWEHDIEYSRYIGNEFLKSKSSLFLKIPSAIIKQEFNILINPAHPDQKKIKILKAASFPFDSRLFK